MIQKRTTCNMLLLFIAIFISANIVAQEWKVQRIIKTNGSQFTIDNLGNIYTYNERIIEKYNSTGKLLFSYSSTAASDISKIDVLNPLRVLVFYKDISQIKFLDNTLSETGININLADIALQQTTLVCNSANKGFWVYDPQNIEVLHIDNNLDIISKTGNLAVLLKVELSPTKMLEFNNSLYVCNNQNILVFDNFGAYEKTIPVWCSNCYINENAVFNCVADTIVSYIFKDKVIEKQNGAAPNATQLYNGKILYCLKNNGELVLYTKQF